MLQTVDIVIYRADFVPVGEDQASHLELSREIVRRFNGFYGEVFPEPKALFTATPKVPGIDGRKMSKSYGNAINLSDSADDVRQKCKQMFTDPQRLTRKDPGRPEVCNLYEFHKLMSPPDIQERVDHQCRAAEIGCVDDKKLLAEIINGFLEPMRQRRRGARPRHGVRHPDRRLAPGAGPGARRPWSGCARPWAWTTASCSRRRCRHETPRTERGG